MRAHTAGTHAWRLAQSALLVASAGTIPLVFDPHSQDAFNLPKFVTLLIASALIAAIGAGALIHRAWHSRRLPALGHLGLLGWSIIAWVAWTAVSSVASVDTRLSILGPRDAYDGLALAVALAVVALSAQAALTYRGVHAVVGTLFWLGGGVSTVYGLVQLHDRLSGNHHWDPVHWGHLLYPNPISTLGNPDHFGGLLAMIAPLGVGILASTRLRSVRVVVSIAAIAMGAALFSTGARGAWLAVLASTTVVGLGLAPEIRQTWRISATVGVILLVGVGITGVLAGPSVLGAKASELTQAGPTSSIGIRVEEWRTGLRIGMAHPVAGTGPGTFTIVFPRYDTARFVATVGPGRAPDGAHNIFISTFAEQGVGGLAVFVSLLIVLARVSLVTWRLLRETERDLDKERRRRAQIQRIALSSCSAGLVAFVVDASFDVQQVALSFCFWLLVGVLGALSSASRTAAASPQSPPVVEPMSRAGLDRRAGASVMALLLAVATTAGAAAGIRGSVRLYGADHAYWSALHSRSSVADTVKRLADLRAASELNPWEPLYREEIARLELSMILELPRGSRASAEADAALSDYRRAVQLAPGDPMLLDRYGRALLEIDRVAGGAPSTRSAAVAALRLARAESPQDPLIAADLESATDRVGQPQASAPSQSGAPQPGA